MVASEKPHKNMSDYNQFYLKKKTIDSLKIINKN